MRAQYLRCYVTLLLLGLAVCLAAKTDPSPAANQQSTKAVPCCASQPDKSAAGKFTASDSKYYRETLQFDSIRLELGGRPTLPLKANSPFTLQAKASPAGRVLIKLVSGAQTQPEGIDSLTFTPQQKGEFVFEAHMLRSNGPAAEPGVRLKLDVAGKDDPPPFPACAHLWPAAVESGLDAGSIVKLLGRPAPFTLEAQGNNAIVIYSKREQVSKAESALLQRIEAEARELRRTPPEQLGIAPKSANSPFTVELVIPHAAALSDLKSKIDSLSYSQFTVTDLGTGKVRIKSQSTPSCETWKGFLTDVHDLLWYFHPQTSSAQLFYLTAGDVSAALNTTGGAQSGTGATTPKPAPATSPSPGSSSADSPAKDASAPSDKASSSPGGSSPTETASKSAPAQKSSVAVAPLLSDRLVFGDNNPGDDELIAEKNRIIAALDLPRPEMIISAWVLQNSSTSGQAVGNFNEIVQRTVAQNNGALQRGVLNAWRFLKDRIDGPAADGYFDPLFFRYVVNRHLANSPLDKENNDIRSASEAYLGNRPNVTFSDEPLRRRFGFCAADEYCLGYVDLFHPLAPRLTDLLLAIIAANDPLQEERQAACWMENPGLKYPPDSQNRVCNPQTPENDDLTSRYRKDLAKKLNLDDSKSKISIKTCETADLRLLAGSASQDQLNGIKLRCFREAAEDLLDNSPPPTSSLQPTPVGLLRAALADFLFHYKMSVRYPHEFSAYDLGRSADVLNSALRPLIEAFNRDVRTFQRFLGAEIEVELDQFNGHHKSLFHDNDDFVNNGLVTVRTISGQATSVDTVSQSFLDASSAPQIADLAKSILGQSNSGDSSGTAAGKSSGAAAAGKASSAASGIVEGLTPVQAQAILGALSAYQSSKVQIGRELSLDVTPRSLNGAVSAEIAVKLNASEKTPPTYWSGPQNGKAADISRVGTHDTSTRVRVDSIKLFDVSAFTAVLERSRSRLPLLPPLVEIPYVGTLVGVPLRRVKEYHSSTALISAIVVPTAADLASVAVFRDDVMVDPGDGDSCIWPGIKKTRSQESENFCTIRRAISLTDLKQPILEFHRAMIQCLATSSPTANVAETPERAAATCQNLTFGNVLHVAP